MAIFGFAAALRAGVSPRTHQVYYDEYEHLDIAQTLSRTGAFAEHLAGGDGKLDILSPSLWPGMYHTLLAWTGPTRERAFTLNTFLSALSVLVVFLAGAVLFGDETAGLFASALWAGLPVLLKYSACADLSAASVFWVSASLLAWTLARRHADARLYALLLSLILCAAHTRLENALLCGLLLSVPAPKDKARLALLGAFALLLLPLCWIVLRNRENSIPGYDGGLSAALRALARHGPGNVLFFLRTWADGLVLLPAAAYGALRLRQDSRTKALVGLSAAYLAAYSAYHIGDLNVGSGSRYALQVYLPLVILAGAGVRALGRRLKAPKLLPALAGAAFLLLALPRYGALAPREHHEAEYRFLLEEGPKLPPGLWVLAYSPPAVITAAGRPSVSPFSLNDPRAAALLSREFILLKDHWWYKLRAGSSLLEKDLASRCAQRTLVERTIGGQVYGFYALTPR